MKKFIINFYWVVALVWWSFYAGKYYGKNSVKVFDPYNHIDTSREGWMAFYPTMGKWYIFDKHTKYWRDWYDEDGKMPPSISVLKESEYDESKEKGHIK